MWGLQTMILAAAGGDANTIMDHNVKKGLYDNVQKGLYENGVQQQPVGDLQYALEESVSVVESLVCEEEEDLVYSLSPLSDVAHMTTTTTTTTAMFQKLPGYKGIHCHMNVGYHDSASTSCEGGTMDSMTLHKEEEEEEDGVKCRPIKEEGVALLPHSSVVVNIDEVTSDPMSMPLEDSTNRRVKFMCSFGGKILPRPGDGRLRYVGGETRIINVNRDISYTELMFKVTEIYGHALTLKYQLPDEELDALVSVSSDEDLENMMEEYDKLEGSDGFSRLRIFLFPAVEYDVTHLSDSMRDQRNPDQQYVDAVNGVPETGSRKHSEVGGVGVTSIQLEQLIGLDVVDLWSTTSVPVGLLAPQISQDMASLIHVPVALPVSSVPMSVSSIHTNADVPSLPTSAPVSPPLIPRVSNQLPISDIHFQFYPEQHSKVVSHQYNVPQQDGNYQDMDGYRGTGPSSVGMHEILYRTPELSRPPKSPTRLHQEGLQVGNHQEHALHKELRCLGEGRVPNNAPFHGLICMSEQQMDTAQLHEIVYQNPEVIRRPPESPTRMHQEELQGGNHQEHVILHDDSWHLAEARAPSIASQGLTRLSEQQCMEIATPLTRPDTQQVLDVALPQMDPPQQCLVLQQQKQQPAQGGWLYSREFKQDNYNRRVELYRATPDSIIPPTTTDQQQTFQQQQQYFWTSLSAPAINEAGYHPVENHMQEDAFSMPFVSQSIAQKIPPPIGSDPSSPRISFQESGRYPGGHQQSQVHRGYNGADYVEQPHSGVLHHPNDPPSRPFHPSPPQFGDHLVHPEERLLRPLQQPAHVSSERRQHEQRLYELNTLSQGQISDPVTRSPIPHYMGSNPFQEGLPVYEEYQDAVHKQQYQMDGNQALYTEQQWHFHPQQSSSRLEYQNQVLHPVEKPIHSQYPNQLEKGTDWGLQQQQGHDRDGAQVRAVGRGRSQLDHLEEDTLADIWGTCALEAPSRSYPRLPEDVDALIATSPGEPFQHRKVDWVEPSGNRNFHSRPCIPQSNVLSGYPPALGIPVMDSSNAPPYIGLAKDWDYTRFATLQRCGDNLQDLRSNLFSLDLCGHILPSILSPHEQSASEALLVEDRATAAPPLGLKQMPTPTDGNGDMRWEEFIGSVDAKGETGVQSCGIFGSSEQLRSVVMGVQSCGMFESSGELQSGVLGGQAKPSVNNIIDMEQEPMKGIQVSSNGLQRKGGLSDDDVMLTLYGLQNLLLDDRPPLKGQKPLATREMQSMLPPTSKMILNVDQTPSIQEFTAATTLTEEMPLSCLYSTVTSIPDCIPSACATAAIIVEVALPRTRLGNKSAGSFEREAAVQNHENMMSLLSSDLSASGHLASDMALALGSESATLIEQMKNDTREDGKETWEHTFQAPLMSSPTFGFESWEENLANIETEFDKVPTQQSLADEKVTPDAKSEKIEVKDQQFLVDALNENQNRGPVNLLQEELKKESYFGNTASDAEAEAISRGLQTIKDADLEEMQELGSGTFGTVYHGKWRGTDVAIKRIRASCFAGQPSEQERLIADFWKEASILSQLHHPNVVAFYGVVRDGPGGTLATVTEYMVNGSLKQVLQKRDRTIDRRKRLLIATDAAFGMEYLHSKNIVHFDLKCENLLVNMRDPHRPICKVGDLGLSKVKHQTMVSGGVRGTLPWMAPELLNGTSTMVTEKVDVFSFGIVMWELLTGEEPYANLHYGAIIGGIVNNTLRPEVPAWCDPTWKLLMERCWASEPVERPGFSEIASDLRTMAVATHPKHRVSFTYLHLRQAAGESAGQVLWT